MVLIITSKSPPRNASGNDFEVHLKLPPGVPWLPTAPMFDRRLTWAADVGMPCSFFLTLS